MKTLTKLAFLLICTFLFTSCNDDEFDIENKVDNKSVDLRSDIKEMEFSYKNQTYKSKYYMMEDSVIVLDNETGKLYNELRSSNKLIFINEDNKVTYFDNEAEYLSFEKSMSQLRSTITTEPYASFTVRLYKHYTDFSSIFPPSSDMVIKRVNNLDIGRVRIENGMCKRECSNSEKYPDLKLYGLNDNISLINLTVILGNMRSDIKVGFSAEVSFWEHSNFEGEGRLLHEKVMWDELRTMNPGEEKIRSSRGPMKAYIKNNGENFNDIVSSLRIETSGYILEPITDDNYRTPSGNREPSGGNREPSGSREPSDNREPSTGPREPSGNREPSTGPRG